MAVAEHAGGRVEYLEHVVAARGLAGPEGDQALRAQHEVVGGLGRDGCPGPHEEPLRVGVVLLFIGAELASNRGSKQQFFEEVTSAIRQFFRS